MGQRLNIEIKTGGKSLANCYYHWSAYTSSSARITREILAELPVLKEKYKDPLVLAIRILESTGASLTQDEIEDLNKLYPKEFTTAKYISRNDGLIAFTPQGMKETRDWEEGRVTIDLDRELILFNVWWKETPKEYKECYEEEMEVKLENIPKLDRSPYVFTFEDFLKFFAVEENSTTNEWLYKNKIVMPIY